MQMDTGDSRNCKRHGLIDSGKMRASRMKQNHAGVGLKCDMFEWLNDREQRFSTFKRSRYHAKILNRVPS